MPKKQTGAFDKIVFMFQGGGALGAYQVGITKALTQHKIEPNWVIGTSIGAVNSAIIAGNIPKLREKKLLQFWQTLTTSLAPTPDILNNLLLERWQKFLSSQYTALFGQPGFFIPRWWNPYLSIQSTADKLSFYDTSIFKQTLCEVIDFDLINEQKVRLSVGAVNITSGELVYFDNQHTTITPEHIMASCALPPGFPAITIGEEMYWDGGIHSNTHLNLLLSEPEPIRYLCFMVHLFDSTGHRPTTMDEVLKRQKDIIYSSHYKEIVKEFCQVRTLRKAIRQLGSALSPADRKNPAIKQLLDMSNEAKIHLVKFHAKSNLSDLSSKDYDFSQTSIADHIKAGDGDVCKLLCNPPWNTTGDDSGITFYEVGNFAQDQANTYAESKSHVRIT
jgi:NTE family protein